MILGLCFVEASDLNEFLPNGMNLTYLELHLFLWLIFVYFNLSMIFLLVQISDD